jgi:hypothetical protein
VEGHVIPGTVIGFYPGTVYYPRELTEQIVKDNDYLIARYDGIVIDGREWAQNSIDLHQERTLLELGGASTHSRNYFDIEASSATSQIEQKNGNINITTTTTLLHQRHKPASTTQRVSLLEEELKKFRNPYGIVNYINHPPEGKQPNVMCFAYDFVDKVPTNATSFTEETLNTGMPPPSTGTYVLPEYLRPFIPNRFSKKNPTARWLYRKENTLMHTVVAIAIRHIENEELLLNYRYNPTRPYPSWYSQPDLEEAKRRWGKHSFFDLD